MAFFFNEKSTPLIYYTLFKCIMLQCITWPTPNHLEQLGYSNSIPVSQEKLNFGKTYKTTR